MAQPLVLPSNSFLLLDCTGLILHYQSQKQYLGTNVVIKICRKLKITTQKRLVALRILIHELPHFLHRCSFYPKKINCPTGHIIYDTALELRRYLVVFIN